MSSLVVRGGLSLFLGNPHLLVYNPLFLHNYSLLALDLVKLTSVVALPINLRTFLNREFNFGRWHVWMQKGWRFIYFGYANHLVSTQTREHTFTNFWFKLRVAPSTRVDSSTYSYTEIILKHDQTLNPNITIVYLQLQSWTSIQQSFQVYRTLWTSRCSALVGNCCHLCSRPVKSDHRCATFLHIHIETAQYDTQQIIVIHIALGFKRPVPCPSVGRGRDYLLEPLGRTLKTSRLFSVNFWFKKSHAFWCAAGAKLARVLYGDLRRPELNTVQKWTKRTNI